MNFMISSFTRLKLSWNRIFWRVAAGGRISFGSHVAIYESVKLAVQQGGKLTLGSRSSLQKGTVISVAVGAETELGDDSYAGEYCVLMAKEKIIIGAKVMIGPHCVFVDYDHLYEPAAE